MATVGAMVSSLNCSSSDATLDSFLAEPLHCLLSQLAFERFLDIPGAIWNGRDRPLEYESVVVKVFGEIRKIDSVNIELESPRNASLFVGEQFARQRKFTAAIAQQLNSLQERLGQVRVHRRIHCITDLGLLKDRAWPSAGFGTRFARSYRRSPARDFVWIPTSCW